jgi:DNA gyrase subunit B
MFVDMLNSQAMLLDGLAINFKHCDLTNTIVFKYDGGMAEYVDRVVEDKKILPEAAYFFDSETGTDDPEHDAMNDIPNYKVDMRLAFNFCRDRSVVRVYHNGSNMFEGGVTVDGLQRGIVGAFSDVAKATGKISKSDRFSYKDIESMLICVASTDAPGNRTWFKNQTKGAINNPFIGKAFAQFVYNKIRYWLEQNTALATKVIAEAVINKKAREEAAEVSKKVVRSLSKSVNFSNKPKDFRDCSSKNIFERELYIVEGRSALGSVKLACNPKFQAVMPVRGKPINCLKENITRVLNNDIIIDLYRVFGCGMEVKHKNLEDLPKFDITKLNWGKLIICTDADVDGNHIRCLLITMFYILSPSLLKAGKVYIAETPLYEMTYKKETKFAFDDNEKEQVLAYFKNMGAKDGQVKIQRSKGLGENDPEMMSLSTMNPETRRLIRVEYPENDSDLRTYFNALLGDDLEARRALIDEYFDLVDGNLD